MNITADASIDFLSSVPSDTLQASGPCGRAYDLQLKLDLVRQHLSACREDIFWEIARSQRPGSLGFSTPDVESHPDVIALRTRVEELSDQVQQAQAELGGIVFLPARENLPEIEKRLAALNRKAAKISSEPITLKLTDETLLLNYKTNDDEDTRSYDFEHVFAILTGTTPQIPGFEFVATITTTEHGNVVKRIPPIAYGIRHGLDFRNDQENQSQAAKALEGIDLTRFRQTGAVCEHCHKERNRNDLYVVYNEQTGETKQVGRTCLREFTGLNDPERVLKVLEQVWEFIRYARRSHGQTPAMRTEDFLTHCATLVRVNAGYQKGLGYDAMTNYYNKLHNKTFTDRGREIPAWVEPTDHDVHTGRQMLTWAKNWDETSEFATNVKLALASETMDAKLVGLGGAVFVAKTKWEERAEQRQAQAERQAANQAKQHVGTVKERQVFTLTLKEIKWIPDFYGYGADATKPLLIMVDEHDNPVKWFASNLPYVADKDENSFPVVGGTYQVKATVKAHEDSDKFGKSTTITRAKFERTISEPEEADE